jgi:aldehyde:ferredoxin oxidoreductase
MRKPADPEKFKAANKAFAEGLRKHPVTGEGLPAYGTNVLTNVVNEAGGYPTNNFSRAVSTAPPKSPAKPRPSSKTPAAAKGPPPTAATAGA